MWLMFYFGFLFIYLYFVTIYVLNPYAICYKYMNLTENFIFFHCRYNCDDTCNLNRSVCCCSGDFTGRVDCKTKAKKKGLRIAVNYVAHLESKWLDTYHQHRHHPVVVGKPLYWNQSTFVNGIALSIHENGSPASGMTTRSQFVDCRQVG